MAVQERNELRDKRIVKRVTIVKQGAGRAISGSLPVGRGNAREITSVQREGRGREHGVSGLEILLRVSPTIIHSIGMITSTGSIIRTSAYLELLSENIIKGQMARHFIQFRKNDLLATCTFIRKLLLKIVFSRVGLPSCGLIRTGLMPFCDKSRPPFRPMTSVHTQNEN